jgi:putative transposase
VATEALVMTFWSLKPAKGLIHHPDRGSQYAGQKYQNLLKQYGMPCGMSRKGNCYDNAVVESFFHALKVEWIYDKHSPGKRRSQNGCGQVYRNVLQQPEDAFLSELQKPE